ncbi:MAG: acetate kinase [Planctomycetaceae bacterium]|nr:acetate kinase [Planctomycetaceae bacterium]
MKIFVCNSGSSSLKFSLFDSVSEQSLAEGEIDWTTTPTQLVWHCRGQKVIRENLRPTQHAEAAAHILDDLQNHPSAPLRGLDEIGAVGHRVVHGGDRYTKAVVITPEVKRVIGELSELAPLHNPAALEGITAMEQMLPNTPQVAVFDTAFHSTLSQAARTYPLPYHWTNEWGIRRYGFHGLSHSYCSRQAAKVLGRPDLRLVIAHLGNGASLTAVLNGASVDTSMGFTPMDGIMMGTRCGSLDPGILIYVAEYKGLNGRQMDDALDDHAGLLGVSGISSDMREVLAASAENPDAQLAIDVYVHRIRQTIGSMAASLGGIDAMVFTAGVGENSPAIRRRVCENMEFLGLELDQEANESCRPDADIASPTSPARILVIGTHEDLTIVRETHRLLSSTLDQSLQSECVQVFS